MLERLKMFKILFLYLVPVNTQNETCTKITSESAVLKQISKSIPFLIQKKKKKKWISKAKPIREVCHFLILATLTFLWLLLFKLQPNSNWIIYRIKVIARAISAVFKISLWLVASK